MIYILNTLIIIYLSSGLSWASAAVTSPPGASIQLLQALDPIPAGSQVSEYVQRIRDAYQGLVAFQLQTSNTSNINVVLRFMSCIKDFELSVSQVFLPLTPFNAQARQDIQSTLESLHQKVTSFLDQDYFRKHHLVIGEKVETLLSGIIDKSTNLRRFIEMMNPNLVDSGNNALTKIPDQFRKTIQSCLGRIFIVKNSIVVDTASGIAIPKQGESGNKISDEIITCGHSTNSQDTDPSLEFYFVSANHLNPRTGLPSSETICNALKRTPASIILNKNFVEYLKKECKNELSGVRRIMRFTAFDTPTPHQTSDLAHHAPRYRDHQDNGHGSLNMPLHLPNMVIDIHLATSQTQPPIMYYALGYPVLDHFDTSGESDYLIKQMKLAPLTISRGSDNPPLSFQKAADKKIKHYAPTAQGMSGGPVVVLNEGTQKVEILGVVTHGDIDANYMCKFW